tara:strand:+ start:879 stop:1463 length:585 start_codon:yes stop_codon:yes gene_type:complete
MTQIEAKNLYLQIKKGNRTYKETIHCPMILEVMNEQGTMTAFCKQAGISDALFYKWTMLYPIFDECYQLGKMYSKSNWEEEGRDGKDDENFNMEYWRITGACRYGVGRQNRIRMAVNAESNPYEQYQQLIKQAGREEFTASEIKQLMESINVGRGAFETFQLQQSIDAMQNDIARMALNNEHNSRSIEKFEKTD